MVRSSPQRFDCVLSIVVWCGFLRTPADFGRSFWKVIIPPIMSKALSGAAFQAIAAERQKQLNDNYQRWLQERAEMAARGEAIGTFSAWQYANNLVDIKVD
jgi:hypothetical protein